MRRHISPWLSRFFIALWLGLFFRLAIVENYLVEGDAMAPRYHDGDLVLITKFDYSLRIPFSTYEVLKFGRPKRGETVALTLPYQGMESYLKRAIALEGDKVLITDGTLFVNDKAVHQDARLMNYGPVDVPPEHFFALNDNYSDLSDSRTWGPVPYSCLKGRGVLVWWSLGREKKEPV